MTRPIVLRGDARRLPLPDASVDAIVTSPPYFALRDYRDGDRSLDGQIGQERTPVEYIANLIECTREWMRVLKPSGSLFVDLGDKYAERTGPARPGGVDDDDVVTRPADRPARGRRGHIRAKSLMLLPERYRIACVDELGLIAREVLIWSKPNGMPESVTDRARRSHEDWVHLVKQPRYFAAVDEVREAHSATTHGWKSQVLADRWAASSGGQTGLRATEPNSLGKLPGSVWTVATEPLQVPAGIDADHFAAYPSEWPRRLILGWSPSGICMACGEGRRPVVHRATLGRDNSYAEDRSRSTARPKEWLLLKAADPDRITGYACACTPYTDHPGTGESSGASYADQVAEGKLTSWGGGNGTALNTRPKVGPWREYHFDRWTPPPTSPAVVLDPFGGTGTTAHVAAALGRIGITVDLSGGYSAKLAASPELFDRRRRKVLGLDPPKPQPQIAGQLGFFDDPADDPADDEEAV